MRRRRNQSRRRLSTLQGSILYYPLQARYACGGFLIFEKHTRAIIFTDGNRKDLKQQTITKDVYRLQNISKRTLQHYRDTGVLPFTQIGHKCYYKHEDVERLLQTKIKKSKAEKNKFNK